MCSSDLHREALLARNPHVDLPPPIVDGATVDVRVAVDDAVTATFEGMRLVSEANAREHWQVRARRVKRQRRAVSGALEGVEPPDGHTHLVTIVRQGPRLLDSDNLAGSAKAVRDAVAEWLGVDDGPDAPVRWTVTQGKAKTYACVVRIEGLKG